MFDKTHHRALAIGMSNVERIVGSFDIIAREPPDVFMVPVFKLNVLETIR